MNRLRIMAIVCKFCPFCFFARKYPQGRMARLLAKEKKFCPFCRAYDEAREKGII